MYTTTPSGISLHRQLRDAEAGYHCTRHVRAAADASRRMGHALIEHGRDGGYCYGHYFRTLPDARQDFADRVAQWVRRYNDCDEVAL